MAGPNIAPTRMTPWLRHRLCDCGVNTPPQYGAVHSCPRHADGRAAMCAVCGGCRYCLVIINLRHWQ